MKVKTGFNLRTICGEHIIVAEGLENIDFSKVISMNESAAYLWEKVADLDDFSADDLARFLLDEYEVDAETALNDAKNIIDNWKNAEIIE